MPDYIDHSTDVEQKILDMRTQQIRIQAENVRKPVPTGRCLYCEESLNNTEFFCDDDCADDFKKYVR